MNKFLLLVVIVLLLSNSNLVVASENEKYLVKIYVRNQSEISQLMSDGVPVFQEFSDAAFALLTSAQLSLVSNKNYTIVDKLQKHKNYFFVYPLNKFTENVIHQTYPVLAEGNEYILISARPGDEDNLAKLQIMLSKIDFVPITLSEQSPIYPDVVFNPVIQQMVHNVSTDSVLSFVRRLQRFRTRYSTTDSCRASANWLRNKFLNYNCDSVFLHNYNASYAPNVVAVKRGIAQPDNIYIVICGHFDATSNQQPNVAPGADDNASGTAAVLESARVMKDFIFEYSVRYIGFSGEEQGLHGSTAYAQMARQNGDSILGVFNFDMISYVDIAPEDLDVIGKISNPNCSTFVNYFINSASTYVPELPTIRRMVTSMPYSDHHPFWQQGYVGFCGIEDMNPVNPHYHQTSDTIGAGFNSLPFCTNVIKAGVAGVSGLANPIFPNQPLVIYRNYRISDSIGNNNGRWDAGETVGLFLTLRNIGQTTANNVYATIACTSSFVTVTQNQSNYGNIASLDTAVNQTPFIVASASNTPIGHNANFSLTVVSAETTWNYDFTIPIGQFVSTDPIPDGPRTPPRYWAYDDTDTLYSQRPTYNWVEIKNLGTRLTFDHNDQVKKVPLPANFGFRFYGQRYDTLSVSVDGFIRVGADTTRAYINSSIPNPDGPAPMIAANWDDLVHSNTGNGGVWWYYNPATRQFIVEWDSLSYYAATTIRDKFQVIFYDTTYTTPTGDNILIVQYKTANRYTGSTIGIEDPTETIGIQYLFDGAYHPAAAPIVPQRAIKFTTQAPQAIAELISNFQFPISNFLKVYPNPFRSQTNIHLNIAMREPKPIKIYNSSGRLIKTLTPNSSLLFPRYTLVWNGKDELGNKVGTGVYFITTENVSNPQKVIYLH